MRKELITKLLNAIELLSKHELESNTNIQEQITFLYEFLGNTIQRERLKSYKQITQHFRVQG